jgi:predicted DNA-binding ribbon-helix-helix protein
VEEDLFDFEKRSVTASETNTTISMEKLYWQIIEKIAAKHRKDWRWAVDNALRQKPSGYNSRAGWLRIYATGYAYAFLTRSSMRKMHAVFKNDIQWFRHLARNPEELALRRRLRR